MKVDIIGGGIGGLAAALAFRANGIDIEVFEAAPGLSEVGAGITMPANALQVLDRLAVANDVVRSGCGLRGGEIRDVKSGTLQAIDIGEIERRFGFGMVGIHRARLQQVFADRLPPEKIHFGKRFVSADATESSVRVRFEDGSESHCDVLVGADGLRSAVRGQIFPGAQLRYSGQTSHRGIARTRLPGALDGMAWEVWGAGRRFGFAPVSGEEVYWFGVRNSPAGEEDPLGGALSALVDTFGGFPDPIPELLARTPAKTVLRTDISDLQPLQSWSRGRIVLLGDAAHATTPNLGQGGAQAIEDAWVLADQLATHAYDYPAALANYERIRKPKADRIVRISWWLGKTAHLRNPIGRALRNTLLRMTPASANERQMAALYELDY